MSTSVRHNSTAPARRITANKVPQVTLFFWIVKILTTGFGEAASDALVRSARVVAVVAVGLAFAAGLAAQVRSTRYVPWLYWLTVALVGVFGTMVADIPQFLGLPVWFSSLGYLIAVLAVFATWYRVEGTLSFASITTRRREVFYWAAVLATFALGTAVGDLTADSWKLGNLASGVLFAALFCVPLVARRRLGLGAIATFWIAYVLTRPLGASFADWMGAPAFRGGLGIETAVVAVIWALAFAGVVVFLAATRNDALSAAKRPQPAPAAR